MAKLEAWKDNFRSASIRVGFTMNLTRGMCEFLSATADDVHWDRTVFGASQAYPDSFLATSRALVKRGLIERKPDADVENGLRKTTTNYDLWSWTHMRLTPAGELVVGLLKLAGLFVEADMAIEKKVRK